MLQNSYIYFLYIIFQNGNKTVTHIISAFIYIFLTNFLPYLRQIVYIIGTSIFLRYRRGSDRMLVGYVTTCAISAYHH